MAHSSISDNCISQKATGRDALIRINKGMQFNTLFVVDRKNKMVGTLTDGDIRRGLLKGLSLKSPVTDFFNQKFRFIEADSKKYVSLKEMKALGVKIIPVLDKNKKITRLLDLSEVKALLPVDVVIMAGGKGERLLPLTKETPKSLLPIGKKSIIQYTVDRLAKFGVEHMHVALGHFADKMISYFEKKKTDHVSIHYLQEKHPLGTAGALGLVKKFRYDYVLLTNSDILTNIDYEDFFLKAIKAKADVAVASIPYDINVPYAIFELKKDDEILNLVEKPTYTYYANAGIYLIKTDLIKFLPRNVRIDITDFILALNKKKKKLITSPIIGYWLDIGKMADYEKAQKDIHFIHLD